MPEDDPFPLAPALAARFTPRRVLGQGAQGRVLLAEDRVRGGVVALKVLESGRARSKAMARLRQEAEAARRVSHPALVRLLDAGFDDEDSAFLAYELMERGSLEDRLVEGPRPGPADAVRWGRDLAGALAALHAAGLVHRDVKPGNVLLADDGGARLADLGLVLVAGSAGRLTTTGVRMGSGRYLAPEVWKGREATPASDQFSLGAVLHEALTGEGVYPWRGPGEVTDWLARGGPVVPAPALGSIGPGLARALIRMLAPEPGDRFPDLAKVAAALDRGAD